MRRIISVRRPLCVVVTNVSLRHFGLYLLDQVELVLLSEIIQKEQFLILISDQVKLRQRIQFVL